MKILVVNSKHGQAGEYIGRPSVLGNPYKIGVCSREEVIAQYRSWLRSQWQCNGAVKAELLRLAQLANTHGELKLRCWCTPLACHGDVVAEAIRGIIEKGLV